MLVAIPIGILDKTVRVRFGMRVGASFIVKQFFENLHPLGPDFLSGSGQGPAPTYAGFAGCLFSLRQNMQGRFYLEKYLFNLKAMPFE